MKSHRVSENLLIDIMKIQVCSKLTKKSANNLENYSIEIFDSIFQAVKLLERGVYLGTVY